MESDIDFIRLNERVLGVESSADHVLPDYRSDVKKILSSRAEVDKLSTVEGDEELSVQGTVRMLVSYLDKEDKPCGLEIFTDIDGAFRWDPATVENYTVDCTVDRMTMRLMGPRKISVKTCLTLTLKESILEPISPEGNTMGEEPELKRNTVKPVGLEGAEGEPIAVSEQLVMLEGTPEDEVEVLWYMAAPTDFTVDEKGNWTAEVRIRALAVNGEEFPTAYAKSIPLEGIIPDWQAQDGGIMQRKLCVNDLRVKKRGGDEGTELIAEMSVVPKVELYFDRPTAVVTDGYLKHREYTPEYREVGYQSLVDGYEGKIEIEQSMEDVDREGESIRDVPICFFEVKEPEVICGENGLHVKGTVRVSGIACQVNCQGDVNFAPLRYETEFDEKVNNNSHNCANSTFKLDIEPVECQVFLQGGVPYLSVKMNYGIVELEQSKVKILSSLNAGDGEFKREESVVTVYYLADGDSLFSVAKTFHTSVLTLAQDNRLTAEVMASADAPLVLQGIRKLLIK